MRDDEDVLSAANSVRQGVTRMARRLRALRSDHGVSGAKLSLLGRLHRGGRPMTAVALASLEGLQPQSLTRLIAELDAQGLIARRRDMVDRRQLLIEITAKGTDLLVLDAHRQNRWLAGALATVLTPTEREFLRLTADLLGRLAESDEGDPRGA